MSLAEIIKGVGLLSKALEVWRLSAIAASSKSIRMEKNNPKPNQGVNKKKVLSVKCKRQLLKLPGVPALRNSD